MDDSKIGIGPAAVSHIPISHQVVYDRVAGGDGSESVDGTITEEGIRAVVRSGGGIKHAVVVVHDRPPFPRTFLLYISLSDRDGYFGLSRYRDKGIRQFKTVDAALGRLEDEDLGRYRGDVLLVRDDSRTVGELGLLGLDRPRRGAGRKARP